MNCISTHLDNCTPENIVMLNMKLPEFMELPLTWLIVTCLRYVWETRADGKNAKLMDCKNGDHMQGLNNIFMRSIGFLTGFYMIK